MLRILPSPMLSEARTWRVCSNRLTLEPEALPQTLGDGKLLVSSCHDLDDIQHEHKLLLYPGTRTMQGFFLEPHRQSVIITD